LRDGFFATAVAFCAVSLILEWQPLKLLVVPKKVKQHHARDMAHRVFAARVLAQADNKPGVALFAALGERYVEIVADRDTLTPFDEDKNVTNRVVGKGLNHGVFFYPGGTGVVRDIITLGPPLVSTAADIDLMAEVLETSINEALA